MCFEGRPTNCSNLQRWRRHLQLILPEVTRFKTRRVLHRARCSSQSPSAVRRNVKPTHSGLSDRTWSSSLHLHKSTTKWHDETDGCFPIYSSRFYLIYRPITVTANCVGKVEGKRRSPCSKLLKHHAMKTTREWGYSATIRDLANRWRWVVSFTSQPLCPLGKCSWYPLDRRLGGPHNRSLYRLSSPMETTLFKQKSIILHYIPWRKCFHSSISQTLASMHS
jgi:hypothetical protein